MDAVQHYTPPVKELLPNRILKCAQTNCKSTFTNIGNYDLHMLKHHGIAQVKKHTPTVYHCPQKECVYHVEFRKGKHFKDFKYLRQHYQKVHVQKTYNCDHCDKNFVTAGQLLTHQKKACGKTFVCNECNADYTSVEALLTHGKRKGHTVRNNSHTIVAKVAIPRIAQQPSSKIPKLCNAQQQRPTEGLQATNVFLGTALPLTLPSGTIRVTGAASSCDSATQTVCETLPPNCGSNVLAEILDLGLADVQTYLFSRCSASNVTVTASGGTQKDQLISGEVQNHSSQCNPIWLSVEDGNATILTTPTTATTTIPWEGAVSTETQTPSLHWPDMQCQSNWSEKDNQFLATGTAASSVFDELLISTETQTNSADYLCLPTPRAESEERDHKVTTVHSVDPSYEDLFISTETQTSFPDYLPTNGSEETQRVASPGNSLAAAYADIFISTETQTSFTDNVSSLRTPTPSSHDSEESEKYATTGTSMGSTYADLFITTETQTSFTQCLSDLTLPKSWSEEKGQYATIGTSTSVVYNDLLVSTATQTNCTNSSQSERQTPTSWLGDGDQYATRGTSTVMAYDDLFVSTETQTSFTNCLLNAGVDGFVGVYTTQHTQTCDMLLGDLFGGQNNDLINGIQSTYTQT